MPLHFPSSSCPGRRGLWARAVRAALVAFALQSCTVATATAEPGLEEAFQAANPDTRVASLSSPITEAIPIPERRETPEDRPSKLAPPERPIVLVVGGDLGLGGSDQPVSSLGAYRHGQRYAWRDITRHLARHINGDINFANLETVITADNRLSPAAKKFRFKSHPAGVRHLVDIGFNAFSLANNHTIDFGVAGMRETLRYIQPLKKHGLELAAGLGAGSAAMQPALATVREATFALSAIGIGGPAARNGRLGMAYWRSPEDVTETLRRLEASGGDYKILSVHYNSERAVRPPAKAMRVFQDRAIRTHGVDLVLGHHAHVAAGVQTIDGKIIFYGLGNLLHPGMQNMARFNRCRDYGLLGRVHLVRQPDGSLVAGAVEVIPLYDMHLKARALEPKQSQRRIEVVNVLAEDLDDEDAGARGLRFQTGKDGTGLYCTEAATNAHGELGKLCSGWTPPIPATQTARAAVLRDCGAVRRTPDLIARTKNAGKTTADQSDVAQRKKRARMRRLQERLYQAEN